MKKIIDYLKHLIMKFTSRPKLAEVYIINNTYKYIQPVVEFLEKRKQWCKKEGVEFRLHYYPFLTAKKCGEVTLYLNGEKMGNSKLYLDKGKVYFKFDE